jgi:uncharacterized SAM-binding protein YcdF (DUF218 family)
MNRGWMALRAIAFLVVAGLAIGFVLFAGRVAGFDTPAADRRADAIVVLTGDVGRTMTGLELLRAGRAPLLLISGVDPSATPADIQRHSGLSDDELDCCVILGRNATDTIGNAREAGDLVRENGYRSLIIVTSDYHLPRSLLEMRSLMPGVELIPHPVRTTPPWRDLRATRLWLQEYAKYTAVWLRHSVTPRAESV